MMHLRVYSVGHERALVLVDLDLEPFAVLGDVILCEHLAESEREEIIGRAVDVLPEVVLGVGERLAVRLPADDLRRGREQLREIAAICKLTLARVRTTFVWSPTGAKKCRGRVPPGSPGPARPRD